MLNKYFGHDAKICRKLKVKDFIYCRWKNGERGIDLNRFLNLLKLSKINAKYIKIKKVDRKIIIFNQNTKEWRVPWRPWFNNNKLDLKNEGIKKWIIKH